MVVDYPNGKEYILSIVKATKLNYYVGKHHLIQDVSVEIESGSMFSIIGPNGAGKSTLLSLLSGENKAEGIVEFNRISLPNWSPKQLAQHRAVLPQTITLNFSFRVFEVVLMGRSPYVNGLAESSLDHQLCHNALDIVGLDDYWHRDYTSLSGGEQQRVQFARVIVQLCKEHFEESLEGKVLFLDEAVANLDPAHQHLVFRTLKRLQNQGLTVVNVLHDLHLTAQYSDHILVVKNAKRFACDTMKNIMTATNLEAIYGMPFRQVTGPQADWPLLVADPKTNAKANPKTDSSAAHNAPQAV